MRFLFAPAELLGEWKQIVLICGKTYLLDSDIQNGFPVNSMILWNMCAVYVL
jgi:hypothetical protein